MPTAGRSNYQRYGISGGRAGDCLRLRPAWMSETFVNGHIALIKAEVQTLLQQHTRLIAIMMFLCPLWSAAGGNDVNSVAAGAGVRVARLCINRLWPAVNGYFFIPVAGQCLAALAFDDTGTTRIGKYVLNHSFMRPGLVNVIVSVIVGLLIGKMVLA